ncbi:hemerythrin domain-containing protein [Rhodococcus gannanensis]|uniref:Hemerythrin domain-containing protein n=1 Tax=Rhodococcus gannanensis TaxID=1960308 RepID=A0ABW4P1Z0_9NOCA
MTTTTTERPNVHEMVVVHRAFRREFRLAPDLIRGVPAGDAARASVVAGHLRLVLNGLEMHHTGEDAILWPLLLERAAPSTGLVETMQAQHLRIEAYVARIVPSLDSWERQPTPDTGVALAALVEEFTSALIEHLDLEEREILPLVLRHLTAAEWDTVGDHGIDMMSKKELPLLFGAVLEDCDDAERRLMLRKLPGHVRLLLRTLGARNYRRYVSAVRS